MKQKRNNKPAPLCTAGRCSCCRTRSNARAGGCLCVTRREGPRHPCRSTGSRECDKILEGAPSLFVSWERGSSSGILFGLCFVVPFVEQLDVGELLPFAKGKQRVDHLDEIPERLISCCAPCWPPGPAVARELGAAGTSRFLVR